MIHTIGLYIGMPGKSLDGKTGDLIGKKSRGKYQSITLWSDLVTYTRDPL